jgi:hypothetical protein
MTQPTTLTFPLTSTTSGTAAPAVWRDFAVAIRESLLVEHPAWATINGVITTHLPCATPTDTPVSAVSPLRQANPATSFASASSPTGPVGTANLAT